MKVLFVGHSPSARIRNIKPFEGTKSGVRLNNWIRFLGLTEEQTLLTNASSTPGKVCKKGSKDYIVLGETLVDAFLCDYYIVSLGVDVDKILCQMGIEHFSLPHPSGLNRKLNDIEYVQQKLYSCRYWLENSRK